MRVIVATISTIAVLLGAAFWTGSSLAGVSTTKHNLSVSGPGTVKATAETQVCIFCHVPHNATLTAALWNRRTPTNTYTPYSSTSSNTVPGQPNGSSLLCLSCHDGTIALGELTSRGATNVTMAGATQFMPAGGSNFGLNLSNHHPVSFVYNAALTVANPELANPATLLTGVKLDAAGQVQCSSCHDAHNDANGKFLVKSNLASGLCVTCHIRTGWAISAHANDTATYSGTNTSFNGTTYGTPWPHPTGSNVVSNGCGSCHQSHAAPGTARLMNYLKAEDNCLVCHNGSAMPAAVRNILGETSKASSHISAAVMGSSDVHDPTEPAAVSTKHVECVDCHNPHQAVGPASTNAAGSHLPLASSLAGVRGVSSAGTAVAAASAEYEICLRCHGDTADVNKSTAAPRVTRQVVSNQVSGNMRQKFDTANPSYHPVMGIGKGLSTPSLLTGWTTASTMKCTHCHNNNAAPTVGTGTGPNGPHGSTYAPILAKNYVATDPGTNTSYNAGNFALCYSCHSSTLINANNATSFAWHQTHLAFGASCSTCHDPHGVPGGTVANNSKLINFNTSVVTAFGGILRHVDTGVGTGSCQLSCHGKSHAPAGAGGASVDSTY